jgi:hypothetical protein
MVSKVLMMDPDLAPIELAVSKLLGALAKFLA